MQETLSPEQRRSRQGPARSTQCRMPLLFPRSNAHIYIYICLSIMSLTIATPCHALPSNISVISTQSCFKKSCARAVHLGIRRGQLRLQVAPAHIRPWSPIDLGFLHLQQPHRHVAAGEGQPFKQKSARGLDATTIRAPMPRVESIAVSESLQGTPGHSGRSRGSNPQRSKAVQSCPKVSNR